MSDHRADGVPVIAMTTYREPARWGVWDQRADLLPAQYADAVAACGGVPLMLPPAFSGELAAAAADAALARVDGLVVAGGADVDPARYAAEPHPRTTAWRPDRDTWELALLNAADAIGLPVLGICRGMQLMAVHAGGRLEQHVPDLVGHDQHSPGGKQFGAIEVATIAGSRVASLVGSSLTVRCHHHQSVATHPGFVAAARAGDGTLEAMEATGPGRFRVAVQWHPETAADAGLLAGLVAAASARSRVFRRVTPAAGNSA